MTDSSKTHRSSFKIFLKSMLWTFLALTLIAIGFFGAELLFG